MSSTASPSTNSPPTSSTQSSKPNTKLDTACALYTASYRLANSVNLLETCAEVLKDEKASVKKLTTHIDQITTLIIPSIKLVVETLRKSGKYVAPIPSVKVICDKFEKKTINEVVKPSKRKCPDSQLLHHFITPNSKISTEPRPSKKPRVTRSQVSAKTVEVPEPKNGSQYTVSEMLENLEAIDKDSGKRRQTILEMIRLTYTPYSIGNIYKMLQKREEHRLVSNQWSKGGRPPLLDDESIKRIANEVQNSPGRAFGKSELNDIIVRHIKQTIIDAGHIPVNVPDQLNPNTLNNYIAQIAMVTLYQKQTHATLQRTQYAELSVMQC